MNYSFTATSNGGRHVALNCYVRLKLINVCVELNMPSSVVSAHQQALLAHVLSSTDAATMGVEVAGMAGRALLERNPGTLLKLAQIDAGELFLVREAVAAAQASSKRSGCNLNEDSGMLTTGLFNAKSLESFGGTGAPPTTSLKHQSIIWKQANGGGAKKKTGQSVQLQQEGASAKQSANGYKQVSADGGINPPGEEPLVNERLADALYKDAWLLNAELLIANGFYQAARDYLFESLHASHVS